MKKIFLVYGHYNDASFNAAIPLIPTNLPLNKKKITTAKTIIIPPINAE